jgi:predicted double-glycine peptidase
MQTQRLWFLFPAALLLGGCASVAPFKGIALNSEGVYVSGLPPIQQDKDYACGAACVAAVAAFWDVPPAEFRAAHPSKPEDLNGADLVALADDLELQAFAYRGSMDNLLENLRQGRPLIVMIPQPMLPGSAPTSALLLNAWNAWGPKPAHWVVVVGITREGAVIIHDPASGPITIKPPTFQSWWRSKDNLTVLIAAQAR